jgi:hypothetical protein
VKTGRTNRRPGKAASILLCGTALRHLSQCCVPSKTKAGGDIEQATADGFYIVCDSRSTARELAKLPDDPSAMPVTVLDSRNHELVTTNAKSICSTSLPKETKEITARKDGQHIQLEHELKALLTVESIGHMEGAIYDKLSNAEANGELDFSLLWEAVCTSMGYLAALRSSLVKVRVAEIAALLEFNAKAAREWAAVTYGRQNTLMGDDPAAAAFAQTGAAVEPQSEQQRTQTEQQSPLPQQRKYDQRHQQPQWPKPQLQQHQWPVGMGRLEEGSQRPAAVFQAKGGAAAAVAARAP